jgi:hypothetical protein
MATGSEDEEDVLLRDRKSLSLAGWGAAFPFLLAVCLLLLLGGPPPPLPQVHQSVYAMCG